MSLPEESVAVNTLPEVTAIPTGKKLIFTDPDTNEGGIITLENLTKQILQNLTSQTFALDQGNLTLLQALNQLNSKSSIEYVNGTFSPIYSITLDPGTTQYDLSKYPTYSMLLIFYANGGISILSIWLGSYSLIELKKSTNGVQISCDFSTKKMSIIVPEKAATILSIIQIK